MKILFYTNLKLSSKSLGGIETLNLSLARYLAKKNNNIYIAAVCSKLLFKNGVHFIPIDYLKKNTNKYTFDIIIGSNDTTLYSFFKKTKKILWLHNKLQIEKSFRKKVFFPINFYRPNAVFVSDYLKNKTSKFFLFKRRIVIPNFLSSDFVIKKINFKRKNIFVWSVQRERGLNDLIEIWINKIFIKDKSAKLFIFGLNRKFSKSKFNFFKSKNVYFYGRVSKAKLKKVYQDSLAMICLGYDETFCLNALEANYCGLPIITFAKTALKDYSKHNHNSIIAKDFNDIENKIFYLLSLNNDKKKKLIINSYNYSKKYQIEIISKKWLKFFKTI
jgi:glycosyltransferase involved in cell wall biosynthesis